MKQIRNLLLLCSLLTGALPTIAVAGTMPLPW